MKREEAEPLALLYIFLYDICVWISFVSKLLLISFVHDLTTEYIIIVDCILLGHC